MRHDQMRNSPEADRRAVLRLLGGGAVLAATGAAAEVLAACSSGGGVAPGGAASGATNAAPATSAPLPPETYDPSRGYWMQGNFAPVLQETDATTLEITGAIPPALAGVFVRNGSNPAMGDSTHWFLGDGMVHGVRLEGGKAVWYRNRWVATSMLKRTNGLTGGPPGQGTNQSNVSAFLHAGKLLTSGEVGFPYRIDPKDLSTVGVYDFDGRLTTSMTAHPKIDPVTGKLHFFGYGFAPPFLTYHVADASGRLERSETVPVKGATMIHDFAITDREAIFWEGPVLFDIQGAVRMVKGEKGAFPFRWDPSYGSRLGILPFDQPGSAVEWIEMDPCYVFHGVNAHRDGDRIVVDVCRIPEVFSEKGDLLPSAVHRWTVSGPPGQRRIADEQRSDVQMDLPGIDRRFAGRPYRHAWFAMIDHDTPFPFMMGGVYRLDASTGAADMWDPKGRERAGEAVFVPGGDGEGEGWVMTYSYDRARDKSDLVIFDALAMAKGPIARVHLPVRVPFGFHGTWVPA